jgi:hypothetical protein
MGQLTLLVTAQIKGGEANVADGELFGGFAALVFTFSVVDSESGTHWDEE